ncbi:MAG: peptidase inhibitor I78 [Phenylobacterium sp.]
MKRSVQALAVAGGLALLAACAAPSSPRPAPAPTPAPVAPKLRVEPPDTCGLKAVRGLVGQLRSAIPVPVNPQLRRVTCTRCAQTQDDNPRRLNIYYDADTGVIERVACG